MKSARLRHVSQNSDSAGKQSSGNLQYSVFNERDSISNRYDSNVCTFISIFCLGQPFPTILARRYCCLFPVTGCRVHVKPLIEFWRGICRGPGVVSDILKGRETDLGATGGSDRIDHLHGAAHGDGTVLVSVKDPNRQRFEFMRVFGLATTTDGDYCGKTMCVISSQTP